MSAERLVQHNGYRDRVWETRGEAFAVSRKLLTFLDAIVRGRKPWHPP